MPYSYASEDFVQCTIKGVVTIAMQYETAGGRAGRLFCEAMSDGNPVSTLPDIALGERLVSAKSGRA